MQKEDRVKIAFPLEDGGVEVLWAIPRGEDGFSIDSVPFYAYGVSAGDVVSAEKTPDGLRAGAVLSRGGHSTYRIYLAQEPGPEANRALEQLQQVGCRLERMTERLISVDVPPEDDVRSVYAGLEEGERTGLWEFEEGHFGG